MKTKDLVADSRIGLMRDPSALDGCFPRSSGQAGLKCREGFEERSFVAMLLRTDFLVGNLVRISW